MYLSQLWYLVKKDFLLEWRLKHALFGVLLYVGCTVFVIYMMAGQPESLLWNALFWIAQLFVTVNTVAKSFLQEGAARNRYYYTLVKPSQFLLAKIVYSIGLMTIMSFISFLLFTVLLGNPLINTGVFLVICITGGVSLAILFTFLSAIAAQARQNAALMAILGFPLAIPLLMILSRLSLIALDPVHQEGWVNMLFLMFGMDFMMIVLGVILFPFLWKE